MVTKRNNARICILLDQNLSLTHTLTNLILEISLQNDRRIGI